MKKLILTILIVFSSVFAIDAQTKLITISGHVTNSNGGGPIPNHLVHIQADSSNPGFSYFNTVITDNFGFYNDSLLIPNGAQILFQVYTFDCFNIMHSNNVTSTSPPLIADFQICDTISNNCNSLFSIISDTLNPYIFYFNDLSTGNPDQWFWDFGDGTTSILQNPTHTYNSAGVFQVCLTIINTDTLNYCTSTNCDFVFVDTLSTCFANFQYSPIPGNPLKYHFIDNSSPNIDNWIWEFGDGDTSMQKNPMHIYPDTGFYLVCLTVFKGIPGTASYCEDTYCDTIQVTVFSPSCQADFDIINNPIDPFTYSFLNTSIGNINDVHWDFGDGNSSTDFDPVHTYSSLGNYNVCLTVFHIILGTQDTLCSDTHCKQISIVQPIFYNIAGQVFTNFFPEEDTCNIQLYRIMNNGDVLLTSETEIDTNGVYFFYQVPAGDYLVKASPGPNNPVFGDALPTYYGDKLHWDMADVVNLNNDFYNADINLQHYQYFSGGPGGIHGKVSYGSKSDDKGPPVSDVEMLLFDTQNIPLRVDFTDQGGGFMFDNLPFGTYLIYPEIAGKNTVGVEVTIDANNPTINDLNFIVTESSVMISLDDNLPDNIGSISDVYPNPAVDIAYLDMNLLRTSTIEFRIFNHIGQIVKTNVNNLQTGENRVIISTPELSNGMYLLQIVNDDKSVIMKKFLKIN